jgi:hypothetical protein
MFDIGCSHAFLVVVNLSRTFGKMEAAMTCVWNGLRTAFDLPVSAIARLWRRTRGNRVPFLDPRLLNAHWRRDLGFDN